MWYIFMCLVVLVQYILIGDTHTHILLKSKIKKGSKKDGRREGEKGYWEGNTCIPRHDTRQLVPSDVY